MNPDYPNEKLTSYSASLVEQYLTQRWHQLCAELETEGAAGDKVFFLMHEQGLIRCQKCSGIEFHPPGGMRWAKCKGCRTKLWFTSDTFLDRAKLIRPWLLVFSLIDDRIPFNAQQLSRVTGISYSSALLMIQKLGLVYAYQPAERIEEVPSFVFSPAFRKRSTETAAKCKPISEEEQLSEEENRKVLEVHVDRDLSELSDIERELFELIGDAPVSVEELLQDLSTNDLNVFFASLTMLELYRLIEALPGQRFIRKADASKKILNIEELPKPLLTSALFSLSCILLIYRGVSRKYIQLYVALVRVCTEPIDSHDEHQAKRNCFQCCMEFGKVHSSDIHSYVSPRQLHLVHAKPDHPQAA